MELLFLAILIGLMAGALASGYPVAFALPGSAILSVLLAAICGYVFAGDVDAYFAQGGPTDWLSSGVTNFRGIYWEVERDTLIAIPLFVFMGIMLQRSKIAEDLLVTMAQLFGPVPGGLGISVIFVGALLAATTGILGATVVAMGLISLPAMLRNNYSQSLATGTIAASGTLGQIIPPSIVLIILADQLASAVDQAGTARQALYKETTGNFSMPSEFGVVSTSAGEMFLGALVPGLVLVGLYMLFVLILGLFRPKMAPSVPFEGKLDGRFFLRVGFISDPAADADFRCTRLDHHRRGDGQPGRCHRRCRRDDHGGLPALRGPPPGAGASGAGDRLTGCDFLHLTNTFEINIKNIKTDSDVLGITLALAAVAVFLTALIWSGWRTYITDDTLARCHDRDGEDDLAGVHHSAWRGDADGGVPCVRRRGTGQGIPDQSAGRFLGAVRHRHGGDLHPRFLPRFHRDCSRGCAYRGPDSTDGPVCQHHGGLARGHDRAQHPDVVPDAAIRLRAILPAWRRPRRGAHRADVQGRRAVHLLAAVGVGHCRSVSRRW